MKTRARCTRPRFLRSATLAVVLWAGLCMPATAQGTVSERIASAEDEYRQDRFDEVILRASDVLRETLTGEQAAAVLRLLILSHMQRGRITQATLGVVELLYRSPTYQPNPTDDPKPFVTLVDSLRNVLLRPPAQDTVTCGRELSEARDHYTTGDFDAAARTLEGCISSYYVVLSNEQLQPALRLLTLAHLNRGDITAAKRATLSLLNHSPDYRPDPVTDPPVYAALVELLARNGPVGVPR